MKNKVRSNSIKNSFFWLFAVVGLLAIIHTISSYFSYVIFKSDSAFWLYSSASQTIAAFVALLITGYSIVLSIMNDLEQKDETLEEIHHQLKYEYYRSLKTLSVLTGASIIFSLIMILIHGISNFPLKKDLGIITLILIVITIVWGISFVIQIINPQKFKITAEKLLNRKSRTLNLSGKKSSNSVFLETFISLEREVREFLFSDPQNYYIFKKGYLTGFRELIESLRKVEVLDNATFQELLEISNYRNLVVHGHIKEIDESLISRIKELYEKIKAKIGEHKK